MGKRDDGATKTVSHRYVVTVREIFHTRVTVEAASEQEALRKADAGYGEYGEPSFERPCSEYIVSVERSE